MNTTIELDIAGLGIIFYSPFAVGHIRKDEEYIDAHFWRPDDVARHVNACQVSAFGTGSPGLYVLHLHDGPLDAQALAAAKASVVLGIEVRDGTLCFRDLYDFIRWDPECPVGQTVALGNAFYRVTVYTTPIRPSTANAGQDVWLHFEPRVEKPHLEWEGVPDLSGEP
jgi:hypothetical protein